MSPFDIGCSSVILCLFSYSILCYLLSCVTCCLIYSVTCCLIPSLVTCCFISFPATCYDVFSNPLSMPILSLHLFISSSPFLPISFSFYFFLPLSSLLLHVGTLHTSSHTSYLRLLHTFIFCLIASLVTWCSLYFTSYLFL